MITYQKRKNHRLKEYDYVKTGYYFVTICAYNRNLLFGEIKNITVGPQRAVAVTLNEYGKIVNEEWQNTQRFRKNVTLDQFIIMPNHIHGIIIINNTDTARRVPTEEFGKPVSGALSTIIRSFKSAATKRINELRKTTNPPIWQPSFYDHIIRDDKSLQNKCGYIVNNPTNWNNDMENPNKVGNQEPELQNV